MTVVLASAWRGGTPRALSTGLGIPYYTLKDRRLQNAIRRASLVVNYGTGRVFDTATRVLNYPSSVARAANKLLCLRALTEAGVPTLEFTTSRPLADEWLEKSSVIAHFDVHGHSGNGLVHYKKGGQIDRNDIKLYTKYFPKDVESRVLLVRNGDKYTPMYLEKVRCAPEKRAERGLDESPSTYIRTWGNGWNFARNVDQDPAAIELAARALGAMKLDFGAVDILRRNANRGLPAKHVVGEINTAPGLEGQTLSFMLRNLTRLIAAS